MENYIKTNYSWNLRHFSVFANQIRLNIAEQIKFIFLKRKKSTQDTSQNREFPLKSHTFVSFHSICWNILKDFPRGFIISDNWNATKIFWGKQAGWIFFAECWMWARRTMRNGIKCEVYKSLRFKLNFLYGKFFTLLFSILRRGEEG